MERAKKNLARQSNAPGGKPWEVDRPLTVVMGGSPPLEAGVDAAAAEAPPPLALLPVLPPALAGAAAADVEDELCALEMNCCPARPTRMVSVPTAVCASGGKGGKGEQRRPGRGAWRDMRRPAAARAGSPRRHRPA